MKIITEEMGFRQRLCEYVLKYGVTRAAGRYQTNRQFVYRQLKNMMEIRRIGPYSPWQNGKVERSHREDGKYSIGEKYLEVKKN